MGNLAALRINSEELRCLGNHAWIPKIRELRKRVLEEAHTSRYLVHPGTNKMYRDLRQNFWWPGLKKYIAYFVERCVTCLQVKAEHQRPYGELQSLEISVWKWDDIAIDFMTKLPRTLKGYDAIWVIVDRLTNSAHFLPIKEMYSMKNLERLCIDETVSRHGVPLSIVSNRDSQFHFFNLEKSTKNVGLMNQVECDISPQTDCQRERTIQTLEDILRACAIDFGGS